MSTTTLHRLLVVLVAAAFLYLLAPEARSDEWLKITRGAQDGQDSYGGRGYAVRYSVPDPAKPWWCVAVSVHGEAYGLAAKNRFSISFMDDEGRVYARSEHPMSFFTSQPEWKIIRITPTQLPPVFWVVVDFKSTKEKGVFIGYANTGGQGSKLTDANCGFHPITEENGDERKIDWCIDVRIRDKYKGKQRTYDPAAEPINKPAGSEEKKSAAKTQDSDHVSLSYTKIEDIWGVSVIRLLETAREGLVQNYGLAFPDKITVTGGLDTAAPTEVATVGEAALAWNVKARNELLPVVRGGTYPLIFAFCRELARIGLRETFADERYAPEGLEEGLAAYLAGEAVRYVEMRCGQKLWPIRYSYIREEGPDHVREWIDEDKTDPARRYASLLYSIDGIVEREPHGAILKGLFEEAVPVREFTKRLSAGVAGAGAKEIPADLFPPEFVDPPFLWLFPEPALDKLSYYRGLKAKRARTDVILSYDDSSSETLVPLDDGFTIAFHTPPGNWTLNSLRLFGCREKPADKKAEVRGSMTFSIQNGRFEEIGTITAKAAKLRAGKPGWVDLGGLDGPTLSGPFLVCAQVDDACRGKVQVGCDAGGGGGHSFRLVPGSHGEPPDDASDWMFRAFLTNRATQEKKAIDAIVREFRKAIPK